MSRSDRESAWVEQVIERYQRPLISFAAHITGDWDSGRDVAQDTFIRLCQAEPRPCAAAIGTWLFKVARNRALDLRKKERRQMYQDDARLDHQPSTALAPDRQLQARRSATAALAALEGLPEKQQEVVRLKLQANLSYREISEATGYSVSNVGFLLHTALKTIRQQLAARGADEKGGLR